MVHIQLKVLKLFKKEERKALDISEKTIVKNGTLYKVGLLWKNEKRKYPLIEF